MRVMITGNMGYVGPALVARLRADASARELVGFDTGYFAHCLTGVPRLPESRLDRQLFGDIRELDAAHLRGIDAIVHLAALSNDPIGNMDEQLTVDINAEATIRLARLAKDAGVRSFVFASSCSVYGFAESGQCDETSQTNPLTAYARSKVRSEQALLDLASRDFSVTCLRFATACGMSPRLRLDLVLNDFVACAVATKRISILSDGTPWRPLIDIADMALAMQWAIARGGDPGVLVNVGTDSCNYQVRDLAEAVRREIPGTEVSINKDAQPDKRSYRVRFGLYARLAPDHQPRVSLVDSIRALRDGLGRMSFRDDKFRDSDLIRLRVLRRLRDDSLVTERLYWT